MAHEWITERVRIADVREREDLQLRVGVLGKDYVKELSRAYADDDNEIPPIRVARIGKALCLVDGFHRLAAAKAIGLEALDALVAPMDLKEAKAVARVANVTHGRKLTGRDKARIFDDYISEGCHLTAEGGVKGSRTISKELKGAYSHTKVLAALRTHGLVPDYEVEEAAGSKWGRGYPEDLRAFDDDGFTEDALAALGGAPDPVLDDEYGAELEGHVKAVESLFFSLGDGRKGLAKEAVRKLLDRMEADVAPSVPERVRIDI